MEKCSKAEVENVVAMKMDNVVTDKLKETVRDEAKTQIMSNMVRKHVEDNSNVTEKIDKKLKRAKRICLTDRLEKNFSSFPFSRKQEQITPRRDEVVAVSKVDKVLMILP